MRTIARNSERSERSERLERSERSERLTQSKRDGDGHDDLHRDTIQQRRREAPLTNRLHRRRIEQAPPIAAPSRRARIRPQRISASRMTMPLTPAAARWRIVRRDMVHLLRRADNAAGANWRLAAVALTDVEPAAEAAGRARRRDVACDGSRMYRPSAGRRIGRRRAARWRWTEGRRGYRILILSWHVDCARGAGGGCTSGTSAAAIMNDVERGGSGKLGRRKNPHDHRRADQAGVYKNERMNVLVRIASPPSGRARRRALCNVRHRVVSLAPKVRDVRLRNNPARCPAST